MLSFNNYYPAVEVMNSNIRRLRELRALSQRELAARARLSVTTVNRIETMQRRPMPKTVRKLAGALGVTPEELLTEQPRLME
jgi:transcriptional regulator with XRE-family HTH domain